MQERIIKLIGEDNLQKIKKTKVCVVGLGGVGGYAVEALIRSGIENIVIVDYDTIDITNLNRQIITNTSNISKNKTDEFEKHIHLINPNCTIQKITTKITENNMKELFNTKFDYLIDACDDITIKELLIKICLNKNITMISSMGTGNKLNPEDLTFIDPSMGSGHTLVYAFDVLMQIYESVGYTRRDAARSIIENNI